MSAPRRCSAAGRVATLVALAVALAACGPPPSPYAPTPAASAGPARYLAVDSGGGGALDWSQLLYGAMATAGSTLYDVEAPVPGGGPATVATLVAYARTVRAQVALVWTPDPFLSVGTTGATEPVLADLVAGLHRGGVRTVLVGNVAVVPGARSDDDAVDAAIAATVRSSGAVLVDVRQAFARAPGSPLRLVDAGGLTVAGNELVADTFLAALHRLGQVPSARPSAST